jgi:hypothetical protein
VNPRDRPTELGTATGFWVDMGRGGAVAWGHAKDRANCGRRVCVGRGSSLNYQLFVGPAAGLDDSLCRQLSYCQVLTTGQPAGSIGSDGCDCPRV